MVGITIVAVVYCHQAVVMSLKALCILKNKESPDKTHSLQFLEKAVGFPSNITSS